MMPAQFIMDRVPHGGRLKIGANMYEYDILNRGGAVRLSSNGSPLQLYTFNKLPDEVKAELEIRALELDSGGLQRADEIYNAALRSETEKRFNTAATDSLQVTPISCGFDLTDMGNAERLATDCGENIRYCATTNTWYLWNGKYWLPDLQNKVIEIAKERTRAIYLEAQSERDRDREKQLKDWAYSSQSGYRLREMVKLAQTDARISILVNELNANPYLLTCDSGTIDFKNCPRDKPYREYRREDLITQYTPRRYDPKADGSKWYETLFGALPPRVIFFLQDAFGYSSIHTLTAKAFFYIYGIPDGRKSSVLDATFAALGDYVTAFDYKTFMNTYDGPAGPRVDIIDLENKRGAQCSELPKDFVINDALIKSTTSANPKHVRGLFEKYGHDAVIKAKLWFESNFMARIDFNDQANFNRLNVIVFNKPLPDGVVKDDKMRDFLQTDLETQDAIFTWIIDGAYEFLDKGLIRPPEVDAATKRYQEMMNPLNWFLNEYCIKNDKVAVKAAEVYDRFKIVAEQLPGELKRLVKNELRGVKSFNKTFKQLIDLERRTDGMYYVGITVPDVWSDEIEGDGDDDIYMLRLGNYVDNVDFKGNFQKSPCNFLAYSNFRKTGVLSTLSTLNGVEEIEELENLKDSLGLELGISSYAARIVETLHAMKENITNGNKKRIGRELALGGLASDLDYKFNVGSERARAVVEKLAAGDSVIIALLADVSIIEVGK